jgi:hypothetical protein
MQLKTLMLTLLIALNLTVVGCAKEEGAMEKMGKTLDEAAESMGEAAEETAEDVKKAVEE